MRYDLFIIWGNGMDQVAGIMKMIRYAFEVVMIYKHQIQKGGIKDLPNFIDDIYSCDSYPLSHLKAKTRYLLLTDPQCLIVLVKNHHVDEELVGAPPYRKVQCQYLAEVKSQIRGEYNIIPEHHMIHGTDYEAQVEHILGVVKQGPLEKYKRQPHPEIPYPWHIPPVKKYRAKEVQIDAVKINVLGQGLMRIQESPHYTFIAKDKQPYTDYFYQYMGGPLREDHFPEVYEDMIMDWTGEYDPILVNREGQILDGGHRACLVKFFGSKTIKTYIL